jgi:Domain of unknown function (DUF4282)
MAKFCTNCAAELGSDDSFCGSCGHVVEGAGVASAPASGAGPVSPRSQTRMLEGQGFIRSLYDFSFSSFVAMRAIKVIYVLITVVYSLVAILLFIGGLAANTTAAVKLLTIIFVPLGYLAYLIIARITLEVLMVIFGIGEDMRAVRNLMARNSEPNSPPSA